MFRIGILGAANIAPSAVIEPARDRDDVTVTAIAARDRSRADAFAAAHDIAGVAGSYAELVGRDDVDAVYIALPAAAHHEWASRSLHAGKHVLCEKPITLDAAEARDLAAVAVATGRHLVEAYHYRHHPLMARVTELLTSGEIGRLEHVEAEHVNRVPDHWPVYWNARLGGGSTLHTGCYPIHAVRLVTGEEPVVTGGTGESVGGVDAWAEATLQFPSGVTGFVRSSMVHDGLPANRITIRGQQGRLRVENFIIPQLGLVYPPLASTLHLEVDGAERVESFGAPTTYACQLDAFVRTVAGAGDPQPAAADAVATMALIDAVRAAAR